MKSQNIRQLIRKNLARRRLRSGALAFLSLVLTVCVLCGSVLTASLRRGLQSMEHRLGADVMVVPYAAITKKNFDQELLLGNDGYFYMPEENVDKIAQIEGVRLVTAQYYAACTVCDRADGEVHLVAWDPETDFSVKPWIGSADRKSFGDEDAVIGADIDALPGDTVTLFRTPLRVAAKLEKTGSSYDNSVFVTRPEAEKLVRSSGDETLISYMQKDEGNAVSTILVDVEDGYDPEPVMNSINIHIKKVKAMQTKQMISGAVSSMQGASGIALVLTVCVWLISLGIMVAVYLLLAGERKKEFALYRVMGMTQKSLSAMIHQESLIPGIAGCLAGIPAGLMLILLLHGSVERAMGLPFLLPGAGQILCLALLSAVLSFAASAIGALSAAHRISCQDTALVLGQGE